MSETTAQALFWKPVNDRIEAAINKLDFNWRREATPKTRMLECERILKAVASDMTARRISRLGRVSVKKHVIMASNSIHGTLAGLELRAVKESEAATRMLAAVELLRQVAAETRIKADEEAVEQETVAEQRRVEARIESARKALLEGPAMSRAETERTIDRYLKTEGGSFRQGLQGLSDDMKAAEDRARKAKQERNDAFKREQNDRREGDFRHLENKRKLEKLVNPDDDAQESTETSPKNTPRDLQVVEKLVKEMSPIFTQVRATINKAKLGTDKDFVLLKCPVALVTNPQLQVHKLDTARIDYVAVPFPGIKYGANAGGTREFIPHLFVFRDQLLVAVTADAADRMSDPERGKKVKKTKRLGKGGDDDGPLTRGEITDIINQRLGKTYLDVLAPNKTWIVNKKFPGLKFMWLLRKQVFDRIEPLSIQQIDLPFSL